jgi:hypothetical protein
VGLGIPMDVSERPISRALDIATLTLHFVAKGVTMRLPIDISSSILCRGSEAKRSSARRAASIDLDLFHSTTCTVDAASCITNPPRRSRCFCFRLHEMSLVPVPPPSSPSCSDSGGLWCPFIRPGSSDDMQRLFSYPLTTTLHSRLTCAHCSIGLTQ